MKKNKSIAIPRPELPDEPQRATANAEKIRSIQKRLIDAQSDFSNIKSTFKLISDSMNMYDSSFASSVDNAADDSSQAIIAFDGKKSNTNMDNLLKADLEISSKMLSVGD